MNVGIEHVGLDSSVVKFKEKNGGRTCRLKET